MQEVIWIAMNALIGGLVFCAVMAVLIWKDKRL